VHVNAEELRALAGSADAAGNNWLALQVGRLETFVHVGKLK
jgi:hypothetical protein